MSLVLETPEPVKGAAQAAAAPVGSAASPPTTSSFKALDMPDLEYTPGMAKEMAPYYERVKNVIPAFEWPVYAPYVHAINAMKKERGALILAHNYMTPEIFHCVGDIVGDSLQLARDAMTADADVIVQAGVHFMAETTKILCPEKTVLIPDMNAGCSLAASITAEDVRGLRKKYPGVPIITYVNTSAEVRAETDICCTSSNAVQIVESLGVPEVLCIPDQFLAQNIARQTNVKVHTWAGSCEVHERFTPEELRAYRADDPEISIIAHPECPPDVVDEADFSGSTAAMINWVKTNRPKKVVMVTECSMSDNVAAEVDDVEFVRPCNLCPHMKRITLPNILDSLVYMKNEIHVEPTIAARARASMQRMIDLST